MQTSARHPFHNVVYAGFAVAILLFSPMVTLNAQNLSVEETPARADDLRTTIENSLHSDPRSVALSQEEFNQLVDALVEVAEDQGVSAEDIVWQPEKFEFGGESAVDTKNECEIPIALCALNEAFGFSGGSFVPYLLFFSSAALLFVLWTMRKMHHRNPQEVMPPGSAETPSPKI